MIELLGAAAPKTPSDAASPKASRVADDAEASPERRAADGGSEMPFAALLAEGDAMPEDGADAARLPVEVPADEAMKAETAFPSAAPSFGAETERQVAAAPTAPASPSDPAEGSPTSSPPASIDAQALEAAAAMSPHAAEADEGVEAAPKPRVDDASLQSEGRAGAFSPTDGRRTDPSPPISAAAAGRGALPEPQPAAAAQVQTAERKQELDVQDAADGRLETAGPIQVDAGAQKTVAAADAGVAGAVVASQRPAAARSGSAAPFDSAATRVDVASPDAAPPMADAPEAKIDSGALRLETSPRPAAFEAPPAVTRVEAALRRLDGGEIEIRLDPPELGRVRVSLAASETGLVATVLAERPEAADLLRRHAETLARSLAEAGHEEVTLQFGAEDDRHAAGRDSSAAPSEGDVFSVAAAGSASTVAPMRPASSGLDLRV